MKVKKLLVAAMFATISAASVYAQDVQLATLQQGEELQVFYGADALKNALTAANDGDLITLTAGTFNAPTITKGVTIQGAGYVTDAAVGKYPTVINGDIAIQPQEGEIEGLVIEGIYSDNTISFGTYNKYITATACVIKKSRLKEINLTGYSYSGNSHTKNCLIDQCRISGYLYPDKESENLYVKNSVINRIGGNNSSVTFFVENCVITSSVEGYYNTNNTGTTAIYRNNIIKTVNINAINGSLASSSSAYNNVFIQGNANDVVNKSGNMTSNANTLFGYAIDYNDNKTYELTEEARTTFLGTDGTQVGIYGGDTPFTDVPTNPQITSKNIATKSTPDGKLNVSIKVEAQNQ